MGLEDENVRQRDRQTDREAGREREGEREREGARERWREVLLQGSGFSTIMAP